MAAGGSGSNSLYSGGWDRPSLDEVIQEGVLGLARAVDKFDPSRGLRFSTYSTHWITSYVSLKLGRYTTMFQSMSALRSVSMAPIQKNRQCEMS